MSAQVICFVPYSQACAGSVQLRLSVVSEKYFCVAILFKPGFAFAVLGDEGKEELSLQQVGQTLANLAPHKCSHSGEENVFVEYTYPSYMMDKVLPFLAERSSCLPCVEEVLAFNPPMGCCGDRLREKLRPYTKHTLQEMTQQVAFPRAVSVPNQEQERPVLKRHNAPLPVCEPVPVSVPVSVHKPASASASAPVSVSSLVSNAMGAVMPHIMRNLQAPSQKTVSKVESQPKPSSISEVMKQMVPAASVEAPAPVEEKVDAVALNSLMESLLGLAANVNMAVGPSLGESLSQGEPVTVHVSVSEDGEQE